MRRRGLSRPHRLPEDGPSRLPPPEAFRLHVSGLWMQGTASPPPSTGGGGGGGI